MKVLKILAAILVIVLAMLGALFLFLWTMSEPIVDHPVKPASARPAACWRAV